MQIGLMIILILSNSIFLNCGKDNPVGPVGEKLGIKMIAIPSSNFQMGADIEDDQTDSVSITYMRPVHTVYLDRFEMSETEITQRQYKAIMQSNPSITFGDSLPVNNVTWFDAARFCNRLSDYYQLDRCYNEDSWECDFTKNGFHLPTEAEWEYACRAWTRTPYYTGETVDDLGRAGWYLQNSNVAVQPVRRKEANVWGLFDMHGNVEEWCNDWFYAYGDWPEKNPRGAINGVEKVIRGGSVRSRYYECWSFFRRKLKPTMLHGTFGFRVARTIY